MSEELKFYADWIFYGSLISTMLFGLTIYLRGRKEGHKRLIGKDYLIFGILYSAPFVFLPLWLMPTQWWEKTGITLAMIAVAFLHYVFVTKKQHEIYIRHLEKSDGPKE
ncbi:hypothetical protein [Geotalea sp. SG265]|uniref:hypothetical protein n=1 Tax=Geotalea sp. SG265 TaxID=2922867 RepID=UPI001FAF082B|nr:hypothetical protein [Geotalea sp. SG265]